MSLLQSVAIGLVQGLTEFLPVSSSGHMVLAKALLDIDTPGAVWEVAFHLGTLLAVVVVFRRELRDVTVGLVGGVVRTLGGAGFSVVWKERENFRLGCYILLGTLPAVIVFVAFGDAIEGLFSKPLLSAAMIFVTGEILWLTRPHARMHHSGPVRLTDSLWIGIAQAAALIPGISRSGTTISAGLACGVARSSAARFSFLLAFPAVLGAGVLKARHMTQLAQAQMLPFVAGIAVAAVSGYIALRLLLRVVRAGKLHWFAYYCWVLSILAVAWLWSGIQAPR